MNQPPLPCPHTPACATPQAGGPAFRGLPAVVVHGTGDVAAALGAAMSGRQGVTLLSAPGAALFAGAGWWRALIAQARADRPGALFDDVLDCADAPGRVLEALRLGQRAAVLDPACPAWAAMAALATHEGAALLARRPDALDLSARGAGRRLAAWLAG